MKQVNLIVKLVDRASTQIKSIQSQIGKLAKAASTNFASIQKSVNKFNESLLNVAKIGVIGTSTALIGLGVTAVKSAGQMEQQIVAFETLLGSSEAANDAINRIKRDAKATPFELPGLIEANKRLISAGIEANRAADMILDLGDAVAATGGGEDVFARLTANLQQIAATGRAATMDIRQFAMAGIPIYDLLTQSMGVTTEKLEEMITTGKVGLPEIEKAFADASGEGGRFAGAMDKQSKTLDGVFANISDTISITLTEVAQQTGLFDMVKDAAERFLKVVEEKGPVVIEKIQAISTTLSGLFDGIKTGNIDNENLRIGLDELGLSVEQVDTVVNTLNTTYETIKETINILTQYYKDHKVVIDTLAISFGIAAGATWLLTTAVSALSAVVAIITSPITLIIVIVGLLIAAVILAKKAWEENWGGIRDKITEILDKIKEAFNKFLDIVRPVWDEVSTLIKVAWEGVILIIQKMWKFVRPILYIFLAVVKVVFTAIKEWISNSLDSIISIVKGVFQILGGIIEVGWSLILGIFKIFTGILKGDWEGVWNSIKETFVRVWDGIKNIFSGLGDVLSGIFKTVMNAFITPLNMTIDALNAILDKADDIPLIREKFGELRIPNIPYLAEGGIVTKPTLGVMGEAGPEAIVPLDRVAESGFVSEPHLHVHIQNYYGDETEKNQLATDIWRRINLIAKAKGQNVNDMFKYI